MTTTETGSLGQAGDISINAEQLKVTNSGQLITNARNGGDAGDINLVVGDRIIVDGSTPVLMMNFP